MKSNFFVSAKFSNKSSRKVLLLPLCFPFLLLGSWWLNYTTKSHLRDARCTRHPHCLFYEKTFHMLFIKNMKNYWLVGMLIYFQKLDLLLNYFRLVTSSIHRLLFPQLKSTHYSIVYQSWFYNIRYPVIHTFFSISF